MVGPLQWGRWRRGDGGKVLSIQSIMLLALGFLTSTLLALTFAPALWSRAVRLTTQRIKERLPVTETEIRADKDRLRAEFAMTVHRLETKIEQADLKRARHMIELNRRDASITHLESEVTTLRSTLEEQANARRVLEHTVGDRLPRVESRLEEARTLLATRDAEISELSVSTARQLQALEEARSINSQQGAEIDRLTTSITVRGGRNKEALSDPTFSGEVALRSEIDALRGQARDQGALIARMQQGAAFRDVGSNGGMNGGAAIIPIAGALAGRGVSVIGGDQAAALSGALGADEQRAALEKELRALRSKSEDQQAEIKVLSAELNAMRSSDAANTPDSKVALRARLTGQQTQNEQLTEQVRKLRAELAAANERLALQGAHFMEQMRRLGAGTLPASGQPRRADPLAPRISLAERVANSRGVTNGAASHAEDAVEVTDDAVAVAETDSGAAKPATKPTSPNTSPRLIDRISNLGKV